MCHRMGNCIALFVLCGHLRKGPSSRTLFQQKCETIGRFICTEPGSHAREAAAQPVPKQAPEAAPQQPLTITVNVPPAQPEPAPPPEKKAAFCHLYAFWKRTLPPATAGSMPQHAAAGQNFLVDCWCLALIKNSILFLRTQFRMWVWPGPQIPPPPPPPPACGECDDL